MFERLGIVTNIWSKRMGGGDGFVALARQFGDHGFKDMEVRDGDYFRDSPFGSFIQQLEAAMGRYTDDQWQTISDAIWRREAWQDSAQAGDGALFQEVNTFVDNVRDLTLSHAISHAWLAPVQDTEADNRRIIRAKKLAYLFRPHGARLRLVDPTTQGEIDPHVAIANVRRYRSLLPDYPMTFAVENARQPATFTLNLAVESGALLTYDEANTYDNDGATVNTPDEFWRAVKMENLTSVHFKQKTADGVPAQVGDGYVDFGRIARHLAEANYGGDLLLENTPTDRPLEDAIRSRAYLLGLL